uniref:Uncharacterized protein n=1 Tax=Chaetoceros debilis TaxID=122233 RepID=A0A7S3Q4R2_9STRA
MIIMNKCLVALLLMFSSRSTTTAARLISNDINIDDDQQDLDLDLNSSKPQIRHYDKLHAGSIMAKVIKFRDPDAADPDNSIQRRLVAYDLDPILPPYDDVLEQLVLKPDNMKEVKIRMEELRTRKIVAEAEGEAELKKFEGLENDASEDSLPDEALSLTQADEEIGEDVVEEIEVPKEMEIEEVEVTSDEVNSVEEDNQSSKVEIAEVSLVDESEPSEAVVKEENDEDVSLVDESEPSEAVVEEENDEDVSLVDESEPSEAVVEEEHDELEVQVQVEESSTASVESVDEAENVTDDVDTNNEDEALLEEHATFDSHDKVDDTNDLSPDSINDEVDESSPQMQEENTLEIEKTSEIENTSEVPEILNDVEDESESESKITDEAHIENNIEDTSIKIETENQNEETEDLSLEENDQSSLEEEGMAPVEYTEDDNHEQATVDIDDTGSGTSIDDGENLDETQDETENIDHIDDTSKEEMEDLITAETEGIGEEEIVKESPNDSSTAERVPVDVQMDSPTDDEELGNNSEEPHTSLEETYDDVQIDESDGEAMESIAEEVAHVPDTEAIMGEVIPSVAEAVAATYDDVSTEEMDVSDDLLPDDIAEIDSREEVEGEGDFDAEEGAEIDQTVDELIPIEVEDEATEAEAEPADDSSEDIQFEDVVPEDDDNMAAAELNVVSIDDEIAITSASEDDGDVTEAESSEDYSQDKSESTTSDEVILISDDSGEISIENSGKSDLDNDDNALVDESIDTSVVTSIEDASVFNSDPDDVESVAVDESNDTEMDEAASTSTPQGDATVEVDDSADTSMGESAFLSSPEDDDNSYETLVVSNPEDDYNSANDEEIDADDSNVDEDLDEHTEEDQNEDAPTESMTEEENTSEDDLLNDSYEGDDAESEASYNEGTEIDDGEDTNVDALVDLTEPIDENVSSNDISENGGDTTIEPFIEEEELLEAEDRQAAILDVEDQIGNNQIDAEESEEYISAEYIENIIDEQKSTTETADIDLKENDKLSVEETDSPKLRIQRKITNEVNDEYITGLDDLHKFLEEVDAPDELDLGATGKSIQDVLVGQGAQILKTRVIKGFQLIRRLIKEFREKRLKNWNDFKEVVEDQTDINIDDLSLSITDKIEGTIDNTKGAISDNKEKIQEIIEKIRSNNAIDVIVSAAKSLVSDLGFMDEEEEEDMDFFGDMMGDDNGMEEVRKKLMEQFQ